VYETQVVRKGVCVCAGVCVIDAHFVRVTLTCASVSECECAKTEVVRKMH